MAKKVTKKQSGGPISSANSGYKASMDNRTATQKAADAVRVAIGKKPKVRAQFKTGGVKKSK